VLLLLILYVGFIHGDGDTPGLLGLSASDGGKVRAAMLLSAVWFALFAWPLLVSARTRHSSTLARASGSSAPIARCGMK